MLQHTGIEITNKIMLYFVQMGNYISYHSSYICMLREVSTFPYRKQHVNNAFIHILLIASKIPVRPRSSFIWLYCWLCLHATNIYKQCSCTCNNSLHCILFACWQLRMTNWLSDLLPDYSLLPIAETK